MSKILHYTYFILAKGGSAAGLIILQLWLSRILNVDDIGRFFIAFSVMVGISVLIRFGVDVPILKSISIAWSKENKNILRYFFYSTIKFLCVTTIFSLVLFFVFFDEINGWVFKYKLNGNNLLAIFIMTAPFFSFNLIVSTYLRAMNKNILSTIWEQGGVAVVLFSILIFLSIFDFFYIDLIFIAVSYLLVSVLLSALGFALILKYSYSVFDDNENDDFLLSHSIFSGISFYGLMAVSQYAVQWFVLIIVGAFLLDSDVAFVSMAYRVSVILTFILVVMESRFASKFAILYSQKNMDELKRLVFKLNIVMFFPSVFLFSFLVFFRVELMVFFGFSYSYIYSCVLVVLLFAQLINVNTGFGAILLNMCGYHKLTMMVCTITGALTVVLSCFFVSYGLMAMVCVMALSTIIPNVVFAILCRVYVGVNCISFVDISSLIRISRKLDGDLK
jgi:O-antigen/teichoic acid export membrane protein